MKKQTLRLILNAAIALMVPAAWLYMVFGSEGGTLSDTGVKSLRYFTVLSNLLEGGCSALFLLSFRFRRLRRAVEFGKYAAAVAVGLTFATVMLVLGPGYGYEHMFLGANLWFHLVVPLLAAAESLFLNEAPMGAKENARALLPVLLYGAVYAVVNLACGQPYPFDVYGFLRRGMAMGLVVFALLTGLSYLIGLALRKGNQRLLRSRP